MKVKKEHRTKEYRVWRDPETKEIFRKEEVRECLISDEDIRRMNKMMYGNSITGGEELYYEAIPVEKPKPPKEVKNPKAEKEQ